MVIGADRKQRPLVASEMILIPEMGLTPSKGITPRACLLTMAMLLLILSLVECYLKKDYWWVDAVLFFVLGLAGIILTAMIFSQHPTVSLNLQILMLNPLALVGLIGMIGKNRDRRRRIYFAAVVFLILFLIGGFWQSYAEGLTILALSLLIRYILKGKVWKGLFS